MIGDLPTGCIEIPVSDSITRKIMILIMIIIVVCSILFRDLGVRLLCDSNSTYPSSSSSFLVTRSIKTHMTGADFDPS